MNTYYTYPDFLNADQCSRLLKRAAMSRLYEQDATIGSEGFQKGNYRTSQSFMLIDKALLASLAERLNVELHRMERPLLIRYQQSEEFKPHVDFHIEGTENYKDRMRNGQRTLSFVFYLNDNYTGGDLYFDRIKASLKPTIGMLAVIVNQWPDGSMNWESSHASLPVIKGTKYILLVNYSGHYQQQYLEQYQTETT